MKEKFLQSISNPAFQLVFILLGLLIFIQGIHTSAHLTMDKDVGGYCTKFVRKNKDFLKKYSY
jgi:membrane-bound ClpP family serine protease